MNKVILMGRLTRDPEVRYSQGENATAVARYSLAVDRRFKRDGEPTADFFNCVAFGRNAEFAEKYLHKGMRIAIEGQIQTRNYDDKDGRKVYVTEVIVDRQEFCESKSAATSPLPQDETESEPMQADVVGTDNNADDDWPF